MWCDMIESYKNVYNSVQNLCVEYFKNAINAEKSQILRERFMQYPIKIALACPHLKSL